jgi:hypothetical protein
VALRLRGEVPYETPQETKMYWVGQRLHWMVYDALAYAGYEFEYELPMDKAPEGWTGRLDVYMERWLRDIKTVRANAFRKQDQIIGKLHSAKVPQQDKERLRPQVWPKPENITQLSVYRLWSSLPMDGQSNVYMDRDGSNPSREHQSRPVPESTIMEQVRFLEEVRDRVLKNPDDLPDPLPRRLGWEDRRVLVNGDFSGDLVDTPDWRCQYCTYPGCAQRQSKAVILLKKRKTGLEYTAEGRKRMAVVTRFLEEDAL